MNKSCFKLHKSLTKCRTLSHLCNHRGPIEVLKAKLARKESDNLKISIKISQKLKLKNLIL
jgi:hypothetical protein